MKVSLYRGYHVVTTQLVKNEYVTGECTLLRRRHNVNSPQNFVSDLCEIKYVHSLSFLSLLEYYKREGGQDMQPQKDGELRVGVEP